MNSNYLVKKLFSYAPIGLLAFVNAACSPINTLNVLVPNGSYTLQKDIAYGDLPRQKLDVYQPKLVAKQNDGKPPPVVLFYYGGSWESGSKAHYKFAAEAFASNGFVTVIPDYRVYPEVVFPDFMADPAKAARWVKAHIKDRKSVG